MMAIARSSWKADAGARPNGFATRVGHKHKLALNHVNELVLLRMRVSRRRLIIRQNPNKVDAVTPGRSSSRSDKRIGAIAINGQFGRAVDVQVADSMRSPLPANDQTAFKAVSAISTRSVDRSSPMPRPLKAATDWVILLAVIPGGD
jgi:hypothetical protein